jgi:two-component system chemotaxis response regulator CheY
MDRSKVNILIVDDVNSIRSNLKSVLIGLKFTQILTANNGIEAIAVIQSNPVHLILADWHMNPVTGFEVLEFVRSNPQFQNIGFIMVTAETSKDKVIGAIDEGVDSYIAKPLTIQQIDLKVTEVLKKKKVLT